MERNDYLKMLVEEMHSTTMATIGADGHPQTRVIDMMLWDKKGVYFLTAKGKAFYAQLMEQGYVAISATKDKKAVSLRGRIQNIHSEKLDEIFGKNPYMQKIYPGDTRAALEVFCVYEAEGEYFDISDPSHIAGHDPDRRRRAVDGWVRGGKRMHWLQALFFSLSAEMHRHHPHPGRHRPAPVPALRPMRGDVSERNDSQKRAVVPLF